MRDLKPHLLKYESYLATMFDGVVSVLEIQNPLKYSFAALGLRELFREFFSITSKDEEVKKCCYYNPHKNEKGKEIITRRQRIVFAIYRYVNPEFFPSDFVESAELLSDLFLEEVKDLSKKIHVTREILSTQESESQSEVEKIIFDFDALIETLNEGHQWFEETLKSHIYNQLDDTFWNHTFDDLDILSTHTRTEGVSDLEIELESISPDGIFFSGNGAIDCSMQFGSDGDCRRGDGLEWGDSFPFTFSGSARVDDPNVIELGPSDIEIDNSSYYE